ncbi:MAG: helix-turn-helix domain-containing protein [Desulfovibrio sp.]|uniref:helix-turn-helix domain-containing protein n=1 Tax=Desulfovibrio sp. 7SRBS1 TaxID=3378064 RepID=UPI003B3E0402
MHSGNFKETISTRLKKCRKEKGMSLDAAAKVTGVSKAMLGQIERRESVPTIAVLWKIASGLDMSFSAFFTDETRPLSQDSLFPKDENMKVRVIFPYCPDTGMEMFEVTLTNHHKQTSDAHHPGVVEHILVLKGRMHAFYDGVWHLLHPGDAVRFHADQPHGYEAVDPTAVFQNIIRYI